MLTEIKKKMVASRFFSFKNLKHYFTRVILHLLSTILFEYKVKEVHNDLKNAESQL